MFGTNPTVGVFLGPETRPDSNIGQTFLGGRGKFWAEIKSHGSYQEYKNPHDSLIKDIVDAVRDHTNLAIREYFDPITSRVNTLNRRG